MKRKGFTLIELLAVIVILAIIALIATPIILGIVEDARKDSFMRSVELVINATDIDIFGKNFNDTYTYTIANGVVSNLEIGVKNTDGMNGSITYDKNGNDEYAIHNGKYCVIKTNGMKKAKITDYVEGECEIVIPTDASYFTYIELLGNFRIIDKDICVEYMTTRWNSSESEAISICNNEPQEWSDGMTLTEWANKEPFHYNIRSLIEDGIIEGTPTNTISIEGYNEKGPKDVVIPSKIEGKTVVDIGYEAFSDLGLTSVVMPDTVKSVDVDAFTRNSLTKLVLSEQLEKINDGVFSNNNLTSIIIPDSVTYIGNAFYNNSLQEVTIPKSVEYVGDHAFSSNLLKKVIILEGVITIGNGAFSENSLQEITIPKSVEYVGDYAFSSNSLEKVIIENDNIELGSDVFCDNPFQEKKNSEYYQKIYDINPNAIRCVIG